VPDLLIYRIIFFCLAISHDLLKHKLLLLDISCGCYAGRNIVVW